MWQIIDVLLEYVMRSIYIHVFDLMDMSDIEVLFLRNPSDELKQYILDHLSAIHNIKLHFDKDSEDYVLSKIDCIVGWRPELEFLKKAENLKLFINPGAGVQHLMGELGTYFQSKNIPLINGHGNSYFTAQHTVAILLALTNKVVNHHSWMKQGLWRRGDSYDKSIPLRNRKIGLLGYGMINTKVHQFLSGFDLKFHILKRAWNGDENDKPNIEARYDHTQLKEFLMSIDVLIIALPSTPETKSLLGDTELSLLKSRTLIVNVGRGDIFDEKVLYNKLLNKELAGAAIDVWYDYQPEEIEGKKYPYDELAHPFHNLENVVLSPHRAASPFDDLERWQEVIHNLTELANDTKEFINLVNIDLGY